MRKTLYAATTILSWTFATLAIAAAFSVFPTCHAQTFREATPGPVAVGASPVGTVAQAPPAVAPSPPTTGPTTQNVVTTTGPVSSDTTISVGTLAGQAFLWMVTAFGGVLGTALTALILKLIQAAGIKATDALRARLQEMVVNGLNLAAQEAAHHLEGKLPVQVSADIKARATAYVVAHGADTIKALGLDPSSPLAAQAIQAHIETAIADPATPTPAVLGGPPPASPPIAPA